MNRLKSHNGFLSLFCTLDTNSNYNKPIYGELETFGFDNIDLKSVKTHKNYRQTSYNDALNNQMIFIMPKRLNKICLVKYAFFNQNFPKIFVILCDLFI